MRINPGAHAATTAADGTFSISGVTAPYDLAAVFAAGKVVVLYVGLTRADPTAVVPTRTATPFTHHGTISGAVDAAAGCKATPACTSWLGFGSSTTSGTGFDIPLFGGYSVDLAWDGSASVSGTLHLLQSRTDPVTTDTSYWYGAKPGVTVSDGGNTVENWAAAEVSSIPAAVLSGTGTVASGYTLKSGALFLELPFVSIPALTTTTLTPGAFTADAPVLAGTTVAGAVSAEGPNKETSIVQRRGSAPNATNFNFDIQAAPSLQAPANAATGVDTATAFSWTAFAGGIHAVIFDPVAATDPQYHVYTAGTTTTIPDLSAASPSVALPAGAGYGWRVEGFAPIANVDAWAAASGPTIPNPFAQGTSQPFGFTTR